jgi:phage terminase large subunit
MEIKSTVIFEKNYEALNDQGIRFVINEGGSRSSKTYSLCQLVIIYCLQNNNKVVSIIRKTFPALRATVLRYSRNSISIQWRTTIRVSTSTRSLMVA